MDRFFDDAVPAENVAEDTIAPVISLTKWLLSRCAKSVIDLGLKCTSVQLAKLVVGLVEEIRIHGRDISMGT